MWRFQSNQSKSIFFRFLSRKWNASLHFYNNIKNNLENWTFHTLFGRKNRNPLNRLGFHSPGDNYYINPFIFINLMKMIYLYALNSEQVDFIQLSEMNSRLESGHWTVNTSTFITMENINWNGKWKIKRKKMNRQTVTVTHMTSILCPTIIK